MHHLKKLKNISSLLFLRKNNNFSPLIEIIWPPSLILCTANPVPVEFTFTLKLFICFIGGSFFENWWMNIRNACLFFFLFFTNLEMHYCLTFTVAPEFWLWLTTTCRSMDIWHILSHPKIRNHFLPQNSRRDHELNGL